MKILVVCQHYYPEPFRLPDICEELVSRGHEVTVITGEPNYPEGEFYPGYENHKRAGEEETIRGVRVHRCHTVPRKTGVLRRVLNYYSFAASGKKYAKSTACTAADGSPFDVVFVNQLSPVMMANPALAYKKKHGTPLVIYTLDLWPESLTAGGIRRGSLIYRHYHKVAERIYRAADRILVSSQMFRGYFEKEFGIATAAYLPQYAETLFTPDACRKTPDGTVDLMFAGNVGAAQGVDTIIRAAALTKEIPNLRWHIVGGGSELEHIRALAKDLHADNVIFHGRQPVEKMPEYYAMADAMLVTMKENPVISYTLPGKVQTYMAAGKPIVASADGETADVIRTSGCGFVSPAGNEKMLVDNVLRLMEEKRFETLGAAALAYCERTFSKEKVMRDLITALEACAGQSEEQKDENVKALVIK